MSERSGIEIDYCPTCRGVWLDRGELDKLIERSLTHAAPQAPAPPAPAAPQVAAYQGQQHQQSHQQPYRKKRKESWLSELFD
jgi:Zn-finger nucleic acid-binding protein